MESRQALSWSVVDASVTAQYLPLPFEDIDCSIAVCEGPWPEPLGSTSIVNVATFWMPSNLGLQSEYAMNFAYSSAQRPCSPFGLIVIVSGGFLPTNEARCDCATDRELELSDAAPFEMKMMKFF